MPSVLSGIGNLDRFNFIGDVLIGQPSYKKISINSETLKNPLVGRLVCLAAAVAHVALLPLATIAFLAAAILTPVPLFLLSKKENTAPLLVVISVREFCRVEKCK